MPTLYVDITQFERGRLNTGIQRVLKEFLKRALQNKTFTLKILLYDLQSERFLLLDNSEVTAFLEDVAHYTFTKKSNVDLLNEPLEKGSIFFDMDSVWNAPLQRSELYERLKAHGFYLWNFLYDLVPVVRPEYAHPTTKKNFTAFLDTLYKYSDLCFFDSHSALDDFLSQKKTFQCNRNIATRVIGLGSDFNIALQAATQLQKKHTQLLQKKYILFVGTIEPRKSHADMLDAFDELSKRYRDLHLVFIAKEGWNVSSLIQRIKEHPLKDKRLHWLQNVDDITLSHFYKNAFLVTYLSKYEGYGLPVAESLAYGNITITSKNSSMYEVGRDFADYILYESKEELISIIALYYDNVELYEAKKTKIKKEYTAPTWDAFFNALLNVFTNFERSLLLRSKHSKKLQFVFISIDAKNLSQTLKTIEKNVDFVKEFIIVTAPKFLEDMQALRSNYPVRVVSEVDLLQEYAKDFSKRDHQSKNWLLRASLLELDGLDDEFIMLDDDNQILKPITLEKFINSDGTYNCYYFYNLLEWTHKGTEYDKGQQVTKDLLTQANYELFSYSSHAPQIINKALLQESVGEFFEIGLSKPIDEWSSYFNRCVSHYPYLFNKKVFETLNWPENPLQWEYFYSPQSFSFENYYKSVYESGFFTQDMDYETKVQKKYKQLQPFVRSREFFAQNRTLLAQKNALYGVVKYACEDVTLYLFSLPHFVVVTPESDIRLKLNYKILNPKKQALDIELILTSSTNDRTRRKVQGLTTEVYQESRIEFPLIGTGLTEGEYNFSFEIICNNKRIQATPVANIRLFVSQTNSLLESTVTALPPKESPKETVKQKIKSIPFFGWLLRWGYNFLHLNNIKHRLFVSEHRLTQLEEGMRTLQKQAAQQHQIILQQQQLLAQYKKQAKENTTHIQSLLRHNHMHYKNYERVQEKIKAEITQEIRRGSELFYQRIEDVVSDLKTAKPKLCEESVKQTLTNAKLQEYYLRFEDRFRGSQEMILERSEEYLRFVDPEVNNALDIGCGRGEWVGLLQQNSIDAVGIDMNSAMLAAGRAAGVKNLYTVDAFEYFQSCKDDTFDLISAFHIVEHIPFEDLFVFFEEIRRIAKPNATILIETPNPANILVGAYTFYKDPTHRNPLPSEVISFMMEHLGFGSIKTEFLHPVAKEEHLSEKTQTARRFNSYFYREQDYLIIAKNTKVSTVTASQTTKPKLAYITPYVPQKTGIAWYAEAFIPYLQEYFEVELINDEATSSLCKTRTTEWFKINASRYDYILYNFGNSAFHKEMLELIQEYSGAVVLHDFYLSNLMAKAGKLNAASIYTMHGYAALQYFDRNGMAAFAWQYPCNERVLQEAMPLFTHSYYALNALSKWYANAQSIPQVKIAMPKALPELSSERSLKELGFESDAFLVCSFGLVGESKMIHELVTAYLSSQLASEVKNYLVIVGQNDAKSYGEELLKMIEDHPNVIITDWVDEQEYQAYLTHASIAVQLRQNSRGENSAALLDALSYGIPTIANANGSIAEIPNDVIYKLPDRITTQDLTKALNLLYSDKQMLKDLSTLARNYIKEEHNPAKVAAVVATELKNSKKMLAYAKEQLRQRQIFVDISSIVRHDLRTGIQRVVRSQLRALIESTPANVRVEAVYLKEDEKSYYYARNYTHKLLELSTPPLFDEPVSYFKNDIFYGLDLNAKEVAFATKEGIYTAYKETGVEFFFMVYDLLPLQRPEFFPAFMYNQHKEWLKNIMQLNPTLITISQAVADDLLHYYPEANTKAIHLGAEITATPQERSVQSEPPRFLMVGTLEPRKGHAQVLEAFEKLWEEGIAAELCIVGKKGWMMDEFFEKLQHHSQLHKQLCYETYVDDEKLSKLYATATALIAASYAEGFGLPLIEAAYYKVPLIVRDIAVFKEVATKHAFYFKAKDAQQLAQELKEWLRAYQEKKHPLSEGLQAMSWQENASKTLAALLQE